MNRLYRYATDSPILLGAGLAVGGVYRIHPPSGLIVGGVFLVFLALVGRRHKGGSGNFGATRGSAAARPMKLQVSVTARERVRVLGDLQWLRWRALRRHAAAEGRRHAISYRRDGSKISRMSK